jgi:predicted transcriptional regulator
MIERGSCTLSEIAVLTNKAPSTISWYLQRLLDANIIKKKSTSSDGVYYKSRFYEVVNKILVLDMLSKYVESPFEKVVSNYSEIVEEL